MVRAERGKGLGRRLIEAIEAEAVNLGVSTISLGSGPDVRGFYTHLGYSGRSRMTKTRPGSVLTRYGDTDDRQRALEKLRARKAQRQATSSKPG